VNKMPYQLEQCLEEESCLSRQTAINIASEIRKNGPISKQKLQDILNQNMQSGDKTEKQQNSKHQGDEPPAQSADYNLSPAIESEENESSPDYSPDSESDEPLTQPPDIMPGEDYSPSSENNMDNSQDYQEEPSFPGLSAIPGKGKKAQKDYINDAVYIDEMINEFNEQQEQDDSEPLMNIENQTADLIEDYVINELSHRAQQKRKSKSQSLLENLEQQLIDLEIIEKKSDDSYSIGLAGLKLLGKRIFEELKKIDDKGTLGIHENNDYDSSAKIVKSSFTKEKRTKINIRKTLESLVKKRAENPSARLEKNDVVFCDEIKEAEYVIGFAVDASGSMSDSFNGFKKIELACDTMLAMHYISKSDFVNDTMLYYTFSTNTKKLGEKEFLEFIKNKSTYDMTNIGDTINMFRKDSKKFYDKSKVLFILTDGGHNTGRFDPVSEAEIAGREGIKIYFVHFPCSYGEEQAGKKIARANKGFYFQPKITETREVVLGEYFSLHR